MKPALPFAQYDKDENYLHILHKNIPNGVTNLYTEEFVRQQQADLKDADKYALELERLYEDAKAEIEALKAENRVLRKGELWLGMVYNNRGEGIAPMYLENFMRFCEENGFTEECGYKLFKAQE